jgi:hypothetical protein
MAIAKKSQHESYAGRKWSADVTLCETNHGDLPSEIRMKSFCSGTSSYGLQHKTNGSALRAAGADVTHFRKGHTETP